MVCIEKRPHKMRGRSLAPNFIYLTCLLDREHIIIIQPCFLILYILLTSSLSVLYMQASVDLPLAAHTTAFRNLLDFL